MHIENGFLDPTTDEPLHLVCRGMYKAVNLLRTLKHQLRSSQMLLLKQCLLGPDDSVIFQHM